MDIPQKYKKLWTRWDVRVLILLSISIQITLIFLGRLRKTFALRWMRKVLWGSYFIADLVANFILAHLSNTMDDSSSSNAIVTFWAPFLILHLGSPDTITAYSMENNELWACHLLSLGYEFITAFYVLFRSLPNTCLLVPTLLIFLVAIIKYLERSYSLYKASAKGFCNSISSSDRNLPIKDLNDLNQAFYLYSASKHFFINLILSSELYTETKKLIKEMKEEDVLKVVSMELSYAYDELYTKTLINHSKVGYVLRVLCSICIFLSFCLFFIKPKDDFDKFDVTITYILLVTSICLDVIATIMLVFSDWMVISLLNVKKLSNLSVLLATHIVRIKNVWKKRSYWLIEMPQLNLLNTCLKISAPNETLHQRMTNWIVEKLSLENDRKLYTRWRTAENTIFTLQAQQSIHVSEEIMKIIISHVLKYLTADSIVPGYAQLLDEFSLDQQVFIWHITTELCFPWNPEYPHLFYFHQREMEEEEMRKCPEMKVCKYLSNYMIHLVLMRQEMMSTMERAIPKFFYNALNDMVKLTDYYNMQNAKVEVVLKKLTTTIVCTDNNKYLFIIARVLAYMTLILNEEERWKVLTTIWVKLLIQKAKNSRATMHMKHLSTGGELLTFIWLLNNHVNMDDMIGIRVDIPRN